MKLLSVTLARAIWLFQVADLNPQGKSVNADLIERLSQRYSFEKVPNAEELYEAREQKKGINFVRGTFDAPSGISIEVSLKIFTDGIMADTKVSTQDSDAFLQDVLGWWHSDLGLLNYKEIAIKKIYLNELHFSSEHSLSLINPKLKKFIEFLAKKKTSPVGGEIYDLGAIGFWVDPEDNNQQRAFRIERVEKIPFSENRYFSSAPLETNDHLELVALFESYLA